MYLLVILAGAAWLNLPSKDVPLFESASAGSGPVDLDTVRTAFADNKASLPDDATLSSNENRWLVRDADGVTRYVIVRGKGIEKSAEGDVRVVDRPGALLIYEHKLGYAETVTSNRAALISVLFISVVFAFLLLLIHIAGKRWQAEGRYSRLGSDEPL